jgi:hypothetical protein
MNKQIRNYLNKLKELGIESTIIESLQEATKGRFFTE